MPLRCAILDDYQNVALKMTDWSSVTGDVEIKVFNQHLGAADEVIAALFAMPLLGYAGYLPFGLECLLVVERLGGSGRHCL